MMRFPRGIDTVRTGHGGESIRPLIEFHLCFFETGVIGEAPSLPSWALIIELWRMRRRWRCCSLSPLKGFSFFVSTLEALNFQPVGLANPSAEGWWPQRGDVIPPRPEIMRCLLCPALAL